MSSPRPDPLADFGRAVLRVLTDPASWKPGPTQAAAAAARLLLPQDPKR